MIKYPKTDKDYPHGYLSDYERIAADIAAMKLSDDADLDEPLAICEVGVWFGGSLEMWLDMFPGATVVGVDVNPGAVWPEGAVKIVMSQDDERLTEEVSKHAPGGYDLIVDDASHMAIATSATYRLLWDLVRPGGYYVVEDWTTALELGQWVASLVNAIADGADRVTYTKEGLVIIKKVTP